MMHVAWGMIIACGKSEQLGGGADIAFLGSGDSPVLAYPMNAVEHCSEIDCIVILSLKEKLECLASTVRLYGCNEVHKVVAGTATRTGSIWNALKILED